MVRTASLGVAAALLAACSSTVIVSDTGKHSAGGNVEAGGTGQHARGFDAGSGGATESGGSNQHTISGSGAQHAGGFDGGSGGAANSSALCAGDVLPADPSCRIDYPPNLPTDPAVVFENATLTFVSAATQTETVVPSYGGPLCLNTTIGWALDFAANPKKIVLCPDTCAMQANGVFKLTVGCMTGTGAH